MGHESAKPDITSKPPMESDHEISSENEGSLRAVIAGRGWRLGLLLLGGLLMFALGLLIFLSLPGRGVPRYLAEGSPQAAAYNYNLALIEEDYPRAWSYLSNSLEALPENSDILRNQLYLENQHYELNANPCVYVESVISSGDRATVTLREQLYDPCGAVPLRNLTYTYFQVELELKNGEWKIVNAEDHFVAAWRQP